MTIPYNERPVVCVVGTVRSAVAPCTWRTACVHVSVPSVRADVASHCRIWRQTHGGCSRPVLCAGRWSWAQSNSTPIHTHHHCTCGHQNALTTVGSLPEPHAPVLELRRTTAPPSPCASWHSSSSASTFSSPCPIQWRTQPVPWSSLFATAMELQMFVLS